MDDVQIEHGYTVIANIIFEKMAMVKLSPTQYRILFVVWRFTYGFKRKEHELSLSFLSKATGCDKRQIQRELKSLQDKKIITQRLINGKKRIIGFNKHYSQWIGEIDIGEIDIVLTVKGNIGETVKVDIGEIDNQENNIKTNINITTIADIKKFYEENGFGLLVISVLNDINSFLDDGVECELVIQAMKDSVDNGIHKWSYVKKILNDCFVNKIITLEQFRARKLERDLNKSKQHESVKKDKYADW